MPIVPSGDAADPLHVRAEVLSRVYLQGGWARHLPVRAVSILSCLVTHGPLTFDEMDAHLTSGNDATSEGLASTAWEPLEQWTDDKLRQLDDDFPQLACDAGPQTAKQAMAEDQQQRAAQMAEMDTASVALSTAPVRTMASLLEFMVACTVVTRTDDGGRASYALNPQAALPGEVLPMSENDRAAEDELRWRDLYEQTAQRIIGLFNPDEPGRLDVLRTSLQLLARELGVEPETARAGLAALIGDPDFTASRDPERVPDGEVLEISIDWQTFARTRISVQFPGLSGSD